MSTFSGNSFSQPPQKKSVKQIWINPSLTYSTRCFSSFKDVNGTISTFSDSVF